MDKDAIIKELINALKIGKPFVAKLAADNDNDINGEIYKRSIKALAVMDKAIETAVTYL